LLKLLIFVIGIYACCKLLKYWMAQSIRMGKSVSVKSAGEIDDVMVKDPYCKAYFPKRNGVHLNFGGKDLCFCSKECRDKFIALNSKDD